MRRNLLIAAVLILVSGSILFAQGAKVQEAKKDGWWIKVDPQKQGSQMIAFYVGSSSGSYGFWRVWNPGEAIEFDVPDENRNTPKLYILAQTTSGQKCRLCMMYKTKGVKHLEFDLEADYEANQTEEDKNCK
jgi:hypothetical protein